MSQAAEFVSLLPDAFADNQIKLLSAVSISHASPGGSVYEGCALAMNVRLTSDFSWVGDGVDLEGTRMVFDVQASSEDWLVLGKKKGYYSARVNLGSIPIDWS